MKKITLKSLAIAFFALALCFSLIACGESVGDSGTTSLGKTEKLAEAISEAGTEYRYSVSVTKGETVQNYYFMRNGDDYHLEKSGASGVDLYYVTNDGNPYIVSSNGTAIVKLVKGDTDYARALGSFLFAKVDNLSSRNYIVADVGAFEPSDESALRGELYAFLGTAYESCEKMTVAVSGFGRISTVRLEFSAGDGTVCEIEFFNYGSAKFTVPSVEEDSTISAVYDAKAGQTVEVKGVVVGVVGNSFYLSDGVCGVYVYSSSSTGCVIGDRVSLSGTVDVYQSLTELKNPSNITVLERGCSIAAKSVDDLDGIERYLSMNIDVGGLSVVGSVSKPSAGENYSVTVSDGTNEITLFLSKYLPSETRTSVYNALKNLKSNEAFSLQDVVVGCYKSYQLEFTESTLLTVAGGTPNGIEVDKTQITLATGTALSDINEKITVYLEYDNGAKSELSSSDFVLECNDYDSLAAGSYTVTVTYGDFSATLTVKLENIVAYSKLNYGEKTPVDSAAAEKKITRGLPSLGNPKVLVIPVDFTDYGAEKDMKSDLQTAFFGTSEQTGWESLSSYYYKSSYGKLEITGTVTDVYHTEKSSTYYSNKYGDSNGNGNPEYEIIKGALDYFDETIDYAQYDSDNDGMIDALYIVYTAPVSYNTPGSTEEKSDFWWAFTYEYYTEDYEYHDEKEADFYMFFGYDFLFETPACEKKIALNCETIIHETGHVLGLDDYYDYGSDHEEDNGGLGGGDMMDYNVGDHNPFSKMLLGWVDPYVVRADCSITLRSFGESGDCVMICKDDESPFSEYFIIDYYTPDGLNAFEAGNSGLFSTEGVRVYHVNATMTTSEVASIWDIYKYSNGKEYAKDKLIALVEADGNNDIENGYYSDNDDLYSIGNGSSIKGLKWRNGSSAGFVVNIARAANGSDVTLTVSFN